MRWTLHEVAKAAAGTAYGTGEITSVGTDSRSVHPGELFVAIRGDHHDGHDFVDQALAAGAAAVMVDEHSHAEPRIEVSDTLTSLRMLAEHRRGELSTAQVVGITGSTGKTSCKDLLASALGVGTWASPRSFNNEIGVPLTVLAAPDAPDVLVLEVGTRGLGHIRSLMGAVQPDVAVITGIGASHLELLGSVATVRVAKWELVEGLQEGGTAVLPVDDSELLAWAERDGIAHMTFGAGGDVGLADLALDELARPSFTLEAFGEQVRVRLGMAGAHQAQNAAAAAAAGISLGRSLHDLAGGLEEATGSAWRMEVTPGPVTIVNDAYNANPTSMSSALRSVAGMPGRHVAVLGMMAELGDTAGPAHRSVGRLARELGYHAVIVVGEDPGITEGAGDLAVVVGTAADAKQALESILAEGDVVLVKASRAVGLEALAGELIS